MRSECTIDNVETRVYRIPLDVPESDGTLTWNATTVVCALLHGDGRTGLGFTYGAAACAPFIDEVLAPVIIDRAALNIADTWRTMQDAIRNHGRPGVASMAMAAVDCALWDLKGRVVGASVAELVGCGCDAVPVYGSGGFTSLSEGDLVAQMRGWARDDGIPRVKMKIATDWGTRSDIDEQRVAAVRAAIGPDTELFVDANGGYHAKQAIDLAPKFAAAGVTWFEEPVSSDDLVGLREVRARAPQEIAAGEYGYDLPYFERMLAAGAVDIVQADVTRCAGITEWLRVATLAAAHELEISAHCAPALHAAFVGAAPNLRHVEYFADHVRAEHLLFEDVAVPKQGMLPVRRDRPGLGLDLKADAERFRM